MSDRKPLVTIVTPTYNRADYLDETIGSVLGQDYPNVEYIVLDDGSKDNTREVLARYGRRLTWESHANMGEARTVNKGWTLARGEIVAVVNSDDPLLPGAVTAAVELMQARPEVLVAYPDWDYIGPDGKFMQHMQVPEYSYERMLAFHYCVPGPGAFIRRRAFDLEGLRDPELKYVGDFDYWLRLGLHGPFARVPKTLATFRVHPGSASAADPGTRMAREHIVILDKLYSRSGLPPEVRKLRRVAYGAAHYHAAQSCGAARRESRGHFVMSVLYHPAGLLRRDRLKTTVRGLLNSFLSR